MSQSTIRRNTPPCLNVKSLRSTIEGIDDYDIKIHKAARWYASNGFYIVPFYSSGGYPKGLSQRHATIKLDQIDKWWHPTDGLYAGCTIAMAHGGQAGTCAVDLDTKKADGLANFANLQMMYGAYDDGEGDAMQTLMATTPSGGKHLIYRYHPEIISNSEMAVPGIDTRGGYKKNPIENGGITFVEPSKKPKEGGFYQWDDNIIDIIDMPQWLVDVLNGRTPKTSTGGMKLQDAYIQSAPGDHGDGRDRNIYMDLMRFAGIGYTEDQLWALMPDILERMDPPDEDMVRRKIESVIQSTAFANAKEERSTKEQSDSLKLDKNDKGHVIRSIQNLARILNSPLFEYDFGTIEYDDFFQRFAVNKKPLAMMADYSVGIQLWISSKFKADFAPATIRSTIE